MSSAEVSRTDIGSPAVHEPGHDETFFGGAWGLLEGDVTWQRRHGLIGPERSMWRRACDLGAVGLGGADRLELGLLEAGNVAQDALEVGGDASYLGVLQLEAREIGEPFDEVAAEHHAREFIVERLPER